MTRWIRRGLTLLAALIALPAQAATQEAVGDWIGTLEPAPGMTLRLAVHIQASEAGGLVGTLDSLDQGARGIPLADIEAEGGRLAFAIPAVSGRYEGRWAEDRAAWTGEWNQPGLATPLILTAAPSASAGSARPTAWTVPDDAAIAALVEARIAARPGVGMVVGVIGPDGRRVIGRGPAGETPFDGGTIFEIGSMTKAFTALLLADMVRRGEVSLDDPAARYLPGGAAMPRRGDREIKLRDLANHRSGLPRLPDNLAPADMTNPYADYDEARLLAFLGGYELTRDIGAQFEYSNLGAGLLGYLLVRRAGADFESLVRERITRPLGMDDTAIDLAADQRVRLATGHDAALRPTGPWDFPTLAGAGALRSSVDDMLDFLALATGLAPSELTPAANALLAEDWQGPTPNVRTALGWAVLTLGERRIALHDGGTGGHRAMMAYDPQTRQGVVVLTNAAAEPGASDMALHLLAGLPLARAAAPE
ncbi:MAG: beta-lactamase family protein [Sphingomonas sp.]|nr:beta-lactamase family protein [Sphingomonas sp.]